MSFFEDVAVVLDDARVDFRVYGDRLCVPISEEIELNFVLIHSQLPAANVYVASIDNDASEGTLVGVVFSVEDVHAAIDEYVGTDGVISVLRYFLESEDPRLSGVQFQQDADDPHLIAAPAGQSSRIEIEVNAQGAVVESQLRFVTIHDAPHTEELALGTLTSLRRLADLVVFAVGYAEEWEAELLPIDDDPHA